MLTRSDIYVNWPPNKKISKIFGWQAVRCLIQVCYVKLQPLLWGRSVALHNRSKSSWLVKIFKTFGHISPQKTYLPWHTQNDKLIHKSLYIHCKHTSQVDCLHQIFKTLGHISLSPQKTSHPWHATCSAHQPWPHCPHWYCHYDCHQLGLHHLSNCHREQKSALKKGKGTISDLVLLQKFDEFEIGIWTLLLLDAMFDWFNSAEDECESETASLAWKHEDEDCHRSPLISLWSPFSSLIGHLSSFFGHFPTISLWSPFSHLFGQWSALSPSL